MVRRKRGFINELRRELKRESSWSKIGSKQKKINEHMRSICPKLKYYRKNNQAIQFRTFGGVLVSGKIIKLSMQPIFSLPYIIIKNEEGVEIRFLLEEINPNTLLPKELDFKKSLVRKTIPQSVRRKLWRIHFGKRFTGECFVCGNDIDINHFDAGHIIAVSNGGSDKVDNLKPICKSCNSSMGTDNLLEFKERYF